ncbi:MAG: hypothetical protein IJU75_06935 [Clostridia bacterium]|nr:hypothetical protein [Clostridia bacterium]
MKKTICILLAALILSAAVGCGSASDNRQSQGNPGKSVEDVLKDRMNESNRSPADSFNRTPDNVPKADAGPVDVDLTKLSSTMVYSEVYNMMSSPDNYMGKRVRMKGSFAYSEGDGRYYFACIIADATACCAQGIEFVLKDERRFPDEYPSKGKEITVSGVFDTYMEETYRYCQLIDAVIES